MCLNIITLFVMSGDANSHRLWHAYGVSSDRLGEAKQAEWAFEKGLTITPANPYLLIAKVVQIPLPIEFF